MTAGMRLLATVMTTAILCVLPVTTAAAEDATPTVATTETPTPEPTPSPTPTATAPRPIPTALLPKPTPTPTVTTAGYPSRKQVEQAFDRLGIPTGRVNGEWGEDTRRAACIWRELTGKPVSRNYPTTTERTDILKTKTLTVPNTMVVGMNVNVQCQSGLWISQRANGTAYIRRIVQVTTGLTSSHPTRTGTFQIARATNDWHESTEYPGAMMYRPMYFSGGQALHGSATDRLIGPRPASHGCVRMLHADVDRLWSSGFGVGDTVRVYGRWKG